MDRRSFSHLLTLGAGALGLWQVSADAAEDGAGAQPGMQPNERGTAPEPVNVADFQTLAEARLPKATYDYITTTIAINSHRR